MANQTKGSSEEMKGGTSNRNRQLKRRSVLQVASSKLVLLIMAYSLLKYLQTNVPPAWIYTKQIILMVCW